MKKIFLILAMAMTLGFVACQKSDFEDSYADPSKISTSTVEKQFTGFLAANRGYVLPDYTNYFVLLRITLDRFTQTIGWANNFGQYIPGAAGVSGRWDNYYNFLAQYRELEKIYNGLSADDQADRRIYMIAATIYLYDHTQKVVDLHGDIPFSAAGLLGTNGGDYEASAAKYDGADAIYTKMLDDLKAYSAELNTISVKSGILTGFQIQDFLNKGDMTYWKKYCNSLRLRMLSRVSGSATFRSRSASEIAEILANTTAYPLVSSNADNIQINVYDLNTDINSKSFQSGLEDWNGNIASKVIIDNMKTNADPRLRAMFEPGDSARKVYIGLDQSLDATTQTALINGGTMAIYNRSTISRNQFFPGILVNAAEVSFYLSEYYLKAGNAAAAKTAYEKGIKESIQYYYNLRTLSNNSTAPALTSTSDAEIATYLTAPGVSWAAAISDAARLTLIATQKWLHYSVIQPNESWSEIRRLDAPVLTFPADASGAQTQPPMRWNYPTSELTYNATNYSTVRANDNLKSKLFWDVK